MSQTNPPAESITIYSKASVAPSVEDVQMNGFAFSLDYGLVVAMGSPGDYTVDVLKQMRQNELLPYDWNK